MKVDLKTRIKCALHVLKGGSLCYRMRIVDGEIQIRPGDRVMVIGNQFSNLR